MRGSSKIGGEARHHEIQQDEDRRQAHQASSAGIDHRRDDVAAQVVARALEFRQALEDLRRAMPEASPARTMLMYSSEKYARMRGQAVGQRLAALEDAQDVQHDGAELRRARSVRLVIESARSSGTPALSSVESSCVKNRTSRALAAVERRQLELEAASFCFEPDVDRRQALAAQFARRRTCRSRR